MYIFNYFFDYKCAIIVDDNSETESTYLEFTKDM